MKASRALNRRTLVNLAVSPTEATDGLILGEEQ